MLLYEKTYPKWNNRNFITTLCKFSLPKDNNSFRDSYVFIAPYYKTQLLKKYPQTLYFFFLFWSTFGGACGSRGGRGAIQNLIPFLKSHYGSFLSGGLQEFFS